MTDVERGRPAVHGRGGRSAVDLAALLISLVALAISIYLTIEHYDHSVTLACPESATINCAKVTTSKWSVIAGVPVALLGLIYYAGMVILNALPSSNPRLRGLRVVAGGVGVAMVLWLVYVELFLVDAICLWCTAVHVLTVAMFVALLWRWLSPTASPSRN